MPNRLDVPDELNHLIEKREQDDRRGVADNEPETSEASTDDGQTPPERREKLDRRTNP